MAGLATLGEYFYGSGDVISNSAAEIDGAPFLTTYNTDSLIYTSINNTQLQVTKLGNTFALAVSEQATVTTTGKPMPIKMSLSLALADSRTTSF